MLLMSWSGGTLSKPTGLRSQARGSSVVSGMSLNSKSLILGVIAKTTSLRGFKVHGLLEPHRR